MMAAAVAAGNLLYAQPNTSQTSASFQVSDLDGSGMTIRMDGFQPTLRTTLSGPFSLYHNAPTHLFRADSNGLPEIRLIVGVPHGITDLQAELSDVSGGTKELTVAGLTDGHGPKVEAFLAADMRGIQTVVVAYRPIRVRGGMLSYDSSATIRLSWKSDRSNGSAGAKEEVPEIPQIAAELRRTILNYDQAKTMRRSRQRASVAAGPSGWGLDEPSMILQVPYTGPYRLTGAEFLNAGGAAGISISDLRLRVGDEYVRFFVEDKGSPGTFDAEDAIEFRGNRNPGEDGNYYSEITDTNAYILTWSGGEGSGPIVTGVRTPQFNSVATTYDTTQHIEKEAFWFGGLRLFSYLGDAATLFVNERVQQERFFWRTANNSRTVPLEFDCSPYYEADATTTLHVRVAGGVYVPIEDAKQVIPITQNLDVILNGVNIGVVSIQDTNDVTVSLTFPTNHLINGTNELRFILQSLDPKPQFTITNSIRLDYLELEGKWNAISDGGPLELPATTASNRGMRIAGWEQAPDRVITSEGPVAADSLEQGWLFRLTSRGGTALRSSPGFYAKIGDEQIASPPSFSLGVSIAEIEPNGQGGRVVRYEHFMTSGEGNESRFNDAVDFLRNVKQGNIVLAGLAFGTVQAKANIPAAFIEEFEALGSSVVREKELFVASWCFAARKGNPSTAVELYNQNDRGVTLNAFIPDGGDGALGNVWSAVVPVSDPAGGTVVAGATRAPIQRFHEADELLSGENQADLIIITHPAFRADAERLAAHRMDMGGLTSKIVDIHRVYDEFNDGVKHPVAIRRFLQYADTNWADPKPGYVLLFGDASWDSQQRMTGSVMIDYVPSSGVPSSDQIYAVAFGDTTLFPRQFIGRLPAKNTQDSRVMVDKIIEYDNLLPAEWQKYFVFATGGQNIRERDEFRDVSLGYLTGHIKPAPFCGDGTVISRSGTTDEELRLPRTNDPDGELVREELNKGAIWFDFLGHGSTTTIDLDFGVAEDMDNGHRYFVLSTWSCETGLFSEPSATLRNEGFLTIPDKGSIASIGGTSFASTVTDNRHRDYLYGKIAASEYDFNLGATFLMSKYEMFAYSIFGQTDNGGPNSRNHMLAYNLLGDPALYLAISTLPELALPEDRAMVRNERNGAPDVGDTVVIVSYELWNYGAMVPEQFFDSGVVVSATLLNEGGELLTQRDTVRSLKRFRALTFRLPLENEPGEYLVRLEADPLEEISETYRGDNVLTLTFLLRGAQPLALEPLPYASLSGFDDIVIRVLNPEVGPGAFFELDTVPTFDSPGNITSTTRGDVRESELVTTWTFSIPAGLRSAETYWWKATSTKADAESAAKFPLIESFTVNAGDAATDITIAGMRQMDETDLGDLANRPEGIGPGTRQVPVLIRAIGQSRRDTVEGSPELQVSSYLTLLVGNRNLRSAEPLGLNVLVFPPDDVTPVADRAFALYSKKDFDPGSGLEALEEFVRDEIEPGQRVIVASSQVSFEVDAEYENGRQRLTDVLESLGSTVADQLGVEDSYILIGGKGVPPSEVKEAWIDALSLRRQGQIPPFEAELRDTITAIPRGDAWTTPVFGPGTSWNRAVFDMSTAESDAPLSVSIVGLRRDGIRDTIGRGSVTPGDPVLDLSTFDSLTYPRIELVAQFANDTGQRVSGLNMDFLPSPELAIVPSTLAMTPDSVLQGDPVEVRATVANLTSFQSARNIRTQLVPLGETSTVPADSVTVASIPPLDSARVTLNIDTKRSREDRSFVLLVNPADQPSEPYVHNNRILPPRLRISTDEVPPGFDIYADDCRLMNGDFVPPDAALEVRVYDNSQIALNEITSVTMVVDNQWITSTEGGTFQTVDDGKLHGLFKYRPAEPFEEGEHQLRVYVKDAAGNGDTSEIISFFVEADLGLRQVMNWPNPFARKTHFTFMVTGAIQPESGEIGIYTAAGRKIKTIRINPGDVKIGFNKIEWDGMDDDRDRLANGVYFYRLKIKAGDETVEAIEKVAVLR